MHSLDRRFKKQIISFYRNKLKIFCEDLVEKIKKKVAVDDLFDEYLSANCSILDGSFTKLMGKISRYSLGTIRSIFIDHILN